MKFRVEIALVFAIFTINHLSFGQTSNFNFSGYLDLYYSYDFFDPAGKQRQFVTQAARHNEFNVNLAFIQADYQSEKLRGTLALQTGTYPSANYGAEPNDFAQLIQTATVGVQLGEKTWIDAGVMGGHFGYEGLLALENELYTQALATEYTPYYQTGIQLSSNLSERLNFRAVIVNGWQNIYETNDSKSGGIGLDYAINQNWSVSYGNYLGKDPVAGLDRLRFHQNIYVTYSKENYNTAFVVDYMLEGLNYDLPNNTNILFITWVHQYLLSDRWKVAGRYEFVEDPTNVLFTNPGGRFQTHIGTVALRRTITAHSIFSLEFKQYFGSENIWINDALEMRSSNAVVTAGLTMRMF